MAFANNEQQHIEIEETDNEFILNNLNDTLVKIHDETENKLKVSFNHNNKKWSKVYINESLSNIKKELVTLENNDTISNQLYKNNFRTESVDFYQSLKANKWANTTGAAFSTLHFGSTLLLSSREEELLSMGMKGDGIWSQDFQRDGVTITARVIGAFVPLVNRVVENYVEDNKYAWEENTYRKWKTLLTASDVIAWAGTIAETYSFNRGALPKEEIYDFKATLKSWENFKKVYLNRFSGPFSIEGAARAIKNLTNLIHYSSNIISEAEKELIEKSTNLVGVVAVNGAFVNLINGIANESLPNNGKTKNILGVVGNAFGCFVAMGQTIWNLCPDSVKSKIVCSNSTKTEDKKQLIEKEEKIDNQSVDSIIVENEGNNSNNIASDQNFNNVDQKSINNILETEAVIHNEDNASLLSSETHIETNDNLEANLDQSLVVLN